MGGNHICLSVRFLLSSIHPENDRWSHELRISGFPAISPNICRIREQFNYQLPITSLQCSLQRSHTFDCNASRNKELPTFWDVLLHYYIAIAVIHVFLCAVTGSAPSLCSFHVVSCLLIGKAASMCPKANLQTFSAGTKKTL